MIAIPIVDDDGPNDGTFVNNEGCCVIPDYANIYFSEEDDFVIIY